MNGTQMWQGMLKENFNVTDAEKLNWVSEYAAVHEMYESAIGVNAQSATNFQAGTGFVPANGVSPIYATPLNTIGMGDPAAPGAPVVGGTPGFFTQQPGSGDIPVSTLPMALNVALITIGLELLPVIPAKGPWAMLTYMDFPYAGGKLNYANNLTAFDGKGDGAENKPIYVKVTGDRMQIAEIAKAAAEDDEVVIETSTGTFTGKFKGVGKLDGGLQLATVSCLDGDDANASIKTVFDGTFSKLTVAGEEVELADDFAPAVDYVQAQAEFVDGFANFYDGGHRMMTRAENETGTGNTLGLRLFSKWIEMGSYEVTGTVTRQQLQDLPLYGVDAVAKIMEAMQNEISQHINRRITEHAFALGVTNAVNLKASAGIDLNLWMSTADTTLADMVNAGIKPFVGVDGKDYTTAWGTVKNSEVNTSAENLHTRQRRISSRVQAAANIIQTYGRRGRPTWIVTNAQVASALQDCSQYVVAPVVNHLAQDGSQNLFMGGTLAGLKVYVDPYMDWNDCRICVGRKGDGNSPGMVFMPYLLADTVQITAEGTMAPKMLVNSRFALCDCGFYPELQYFTFAVGSSFGII